MGYRPFAPASRRLTVRSCRPGTVAGVSRVAPIRDVALGAACLATWWIVDDGRAAAHSLSASDDRLGAMWAVIAAVAWRRARRRVGRGPSRRPARDEAGDDRRRAAGHEREQADDAHRVSPPRVGDGEEPEPGDEAGHGAARSERGRPR